MLQNFSSTSSLIVRAGPPVMSMSVVVRRLKSGDVRSTRKWRGSSQRRPPNPAPLAAVSSVESPPVDATTCVRPGTFSVMV